VSKDKILVVEDAPDISSLLKIYFTSQGFEVMTAMRGQVALEMCRKTPPNLALLDVNLPDMEGYDIGRTLRQSARTRHIPIIFLTGSKDPALRQKVMDLGAAGLLEKPYEPEELLLMVQMAFDRPGGPRTKRLPTPLPPDQESNPKRILIVEDDERIAKALAVRLASAGYETSMAHDGLAGFRAAVVEKPDLVLLDISLAAGDGFTVAERIQSNIPRPIPMIFLTASKRPEFRQKAQGLGAIGFFEKPFETNALLTAINKAVRPIRTPYP